MFKVMGLENWNQPTTSALNWGRLESFQRKSELPFVIASGEVPDLQAIARNAVVGLFLFSSMYALQITTAFRFSGKKSH